MNLGKVIFEETETIVISKNILPSEKHKFLREVMDIYGKLLDEQSEKEFIPVEIKNET